MRPPITRRRSSRTLLWRSGTQRSHDLTLAEEGANLDQLLAQQCPALSAAAAARPPMLLTVLAWLEVALSAAFALCFVSGFLGLAWFVVGNQYPSLAPGLVARCFLLGVALPVSILQAMVWLVVVMCGCVQPKLQAHIAFVHLVKYLPCATSAGPFDPSNSALLPGKRDHDKPRKNLALQPRLSNIARRGAAHSWHSVSVCSLRGSRTSRRRRARRIATGAFSACVYA